MGISKDSAASILNAGSNLRIPVLTPESCIELARIAKERDVQLEIKGGNLTTETMVAIANAGGKNVTFDIP
jgi:hypothetical protein